MSDIQEISFQNVVDTILKPEGIKVGGFPDDLFLDLTDEERERWQCNICFLVSHDPKHCGNKHIFCATCVFAWSMTYGANSDKCPVCRLKQQDYLTNRKIENEILQKWVKCPEAGCALRCPLRDFLQHSHGIKLYGSPTDLNSLRRNRPAPVGSSVGGAIHFLPSFTSSASSNISMGRNLLQDMLQVWHMEMELRRRAIERFHANTDDDTRRRHFDEIIAIQTHIMEISYFLNMLFNSRTERSNPTNLLGGMNSFPGSTSRNNDDDSSSDSSDSSESTEAFARSRQAIRNRPPIARTRVTSNHNTTGPSINSSTSQRISSNNEQSTSNNERSIPQLNGLTSSTASRNPSNTTSSNRSILNSRRVESITSNTTNQNNSNTEFETVTPLQPSSNLAQVSGGSDEPTSSSTAQSAVEQLPPITRVDSIVEENDRSVNSNSRTHTTSIQPGRTAAPHRRPAPPAGPGPTVNTTRVRRRTQTTDNSTSSTSTQRAAVSRASNLSRTGGSRTRGRSDSSLPSTSGALLRARRRSEIQQQLMHNETEDETTEGP